MQSSRLLSEVRTVTLTALQSPVTARYMQTRLPTHHGDPRRPALSQECRNADSPLLQTSPFLELDHTTATAQIPAQGRGEQNPLI